MKPNLPKENDLRIYFSSNGVVRTYAVGSVEEGAYLFKKLAEGDLSTEDVSWNVMDLEIFEEDEWCTWRNEDGQDLDEVLNSGEGDEQLGTYPKHD